MRCRTSESIDNLPKASLITCTAFRKVRYYVNIARDERERKDQETGVEIISSYYRDARLGRSARDKKKGKRRKKGGNVRSGGGGGGCPAAFHCSRSLARPRKLFALSLSLFRARYSPRKLRREKRPSSG